MKIYRERKLPHIYPIGGIFFITFRLDDSLPKHIIAEFEKEISIEKEKIKLIEKNAVKRLAAFKELNKRKFGKYEHQLDHKPYGECVMKNTQVARIINDKIMDYDSEYYIVESLSIMPNHIHILVDTSIQIDPKTGHPKSNYTQVDKWMNLIKGSTSRNINKYLGRSGKLWSNESYDHIVRDESSLEKIRNYILYNPINARLETKYRKAPYLYNFER